MTTPMPTPTVDYPVRFSVDYPEGPRNRMTAFFRIIMVLPVLAVLTAISMRGNTGLVAVAFGPVLGVMLMLVFRQKYPRWWFDWIAGVARFGARVTSYVMLLRDEYPATDEEQSVHLAIDYPDAAQLNRWLPLVKWFLAIPHYLVLAVLTFAAGIGTFVGWLAILFTGGYPRDLFEFSVAVQAWHLRVVGYAFYLVTDRYPPFSLGRPFGGAGMALVVAAVALMILGAVIWAAALAAMMSGFPGGMMYY